MILLTGCSVSKNFYVANVQDLTQMDKSAFIYALPRTVVTTEVTAIRHVTIPGPYHEYADEFLGIKDVPHEKKVFWTIDHATLDSHVEVDPDYYYSVKDPGSAEKRNVSVNRKRANIGCIESGPVFRQSGKPIR